MSETFETFSSIKYEFLEISNIVLISKRQYLRKPRYFKLIVYIFLFKCILDLVFFSRDRQTTSSSREHYVAARVYPAVHPCLPSSTLV
jgi:hypothetical protein